MCAQSATHPITMTALIRVSSYLLPKKAGIRLIYRIPSSHRIRLRTSCQMPTSTNVRTALSVSTAVSQKQARRDWISGLRISSYAQTATRKRRIRSTVLSVKYFGLLQMKSKMRTCKMLCLKSRMSSNRWCNASHARCGFIMSVIEFY